MFQKVFGDDREAEGPWGDQGLYCRHCQGGQAGGGLTWEKPRAPGIQRERPEIPDLLAHNYQVRILCDFLVNKENTNFKSFKVIIFEFFLFKTFYFNQCDNLFNKLKTKFYKFRAAF